MWLADDAPLAWERHGGLWLPTPQRLERAHYDELACVGNIQIDVWRVDHSGHAHLWTERGHNLVPTAGRNLLRDRLRNNTAAALSHFAVGTGNVAPSNNDTALATEVFREAFTSITVDTLKLIVKYYLPQTSANGNTLREGALFNASAGGTMYNRFILATAIVKTVSVAVTFTAELSWTVTAMQATERGQYFTFGGDATLYDQGTNYPAGAGLDKLAKGSGPMSQDSADLQGGTFVAEFVVRTFNGTGAVAPTCCLVNLDDGSPDTALTGSEATGTAGNDVYQRFRSGAVTWPGAGTAKKIGVKVKTNEAAGRVSLIGASLIRTG